MYSLNIHYPPGQQYAVNSMTYRGTVQLPAGVSGQLRTIYYFQGSAIQSTASQKYNGPLTKDITNNDQMNVDNKTWSSCNQVYPININTQINLTGDLTKKATITTDSIDGKITYNVAMVWQNC